MEGRRQIIAHLKRRGPASVSELAGALGLSENAVRHHLAWLERHGLLDVELRREGVGRPSKVYALGPQAEGLFPKRYDELLLLVLEEAHDEGHLEALLDGVAARLAKRLAERLSATLPPGDPETRLEALLEHLDYGEMLSEVTASEGVWELRAHNCVYREAGCRFEAVCDLLPKVIQRITGFAAERPRCQRDGERACTFVVSRS